MGSATSSPVSRAFAVPDPTIALLVVGIAIVLYLLKQHTDFKKRKGGARTLPGPKGVPVIGNLRQLPKLKPWVQLKEWSEVYGG